MKIAYVRLRYGSHTAKTWLQHSTDLMPGLCIEIAEAPGREYELDEILDVFENDHDCHAWRITRFSGRLIRHET